MNNDDVNQKFAARAAGYTRDGSHAMFVQAVEQGLLEQAQEHRDTIRLTIYRRLINCARRIRIAGAIMSGIAVAAGYFYQSFVWKCIGFCGALLSVVSVMCKRF
jgi:hypothetical protein